jgi:shikimate dehydrogenase
MKIEGRSAIVIGAGGAARAIAHCLQEAGAHVRIANRGRARGEALAKELGVAYLAIDDIDADPERILVQATSAPWEDLLVPPKALRASFLLDVRYREKEESALVLAAREAGTAAEGGRGMLGNQAEAQIRLFTGRDPRKLPLVPDS